MRSVGLITEYNPFHNGHLHHLQQSKALAQAEVAVAVMSGHFLQRGEPALVDKWTRTRMALAAGADLVVELPFPWACNSAPQFAAGAVAALEALGGIDSLCFGSEAGSLELLQRCAGLLIDRAVEIKQQTADLLRQGISYPAARAQVVAALAPGEVDQQQLAAPNNILGIEYLKALRLADSSIEPLTLPRLGAGYHDTAAVGDIASATGIRGLLAAGEAVDPYLPPSSLTLLRQEAGNGRLVDDILLQRQLVSAILRSPERLARIYQVEHGLQQRLAQAARTGSSYPELVEAVKSRQFTRTRIQRLLSYVLLGVEAEPMSAILASGPLYLHLLGCSERGRAFLASSRKARRLPLIQNFSRVEAVLKRTYQNSPTLLHSARLQLQLELRATEFYTLLQRTPAAGALNRDFYIHLQTPD